MAKSSSDIFEHWARIGASFGGELADALKKSSDLLRPLGEPLEHEFGLNRWLAGAREESYSDWFGWLFAHMTADELGRVLALPKLLRQGSEPVEVLRECWVEHGHEGHTGRLDLRLTISNTAVVIVELKLGTADPADTEKQRGYRDSVEADFHHLERYYILLVTSCNTEDVHGFQPRTYEKFCRNLRRLAIERINQEETFAASAILMLAATVESNLLGYSASVGSSMPNTLAHLRAFIRKDNGYE